MALPAGAVLGDVAGAFVKRRTGRERGAPFPVVDQLGSVVGALASSLLLASLFHLGTNAAAYRLGLKDEPW